MEELTEIILFESEKHWYLPYFFKNIVVNWTLSSLDEGSLEITVSVPVNNLLHFTIFYLTISEIKMINTIIQYLITMITTILRLNTIFNKK